MSLLTKSTKDFIASLNEACGLESTASFAAIKDSETERTLLVENAAKAMIETYGEGFEALGAIGQQMLKEDIAIATQVIRNNMESESFNETTNINMLTSSIATTMRKPMEANIHRVYDVEAANSPIITMEQYFDTLTNADNEVTDAFNAFNDSTFLNSIVESLPIGTAGIAPSRTGTDLLAGHDKGVHKIDRDARISGIKYLVGGTPVPVADIKYKRGSIPYFDSKHGVCEVTFTVKTGVSTYVDVRVDAKLNFATGRLEYCNVDNPKTGDTGVELVYFDLHLAFDAHTTAITVGARNSFLSLPIPTQPHFEVSETLETLKDLSTGESSLKGKDFVSSLTEKMVTFTSQKEDLTLFNLLEKSGNHMYEMTYDYEAPSTYAAGSPFEWIKLNFINMVDVACTSMKKDYHVKNAVFKILVSPIMLRIIDNGYNMNTDESIVSALNYSVVAKTVANTLVFVSSERYDATGQINMILNDRQDAIIKTFHYWKYQSFLTDALQSSKNNTRKAIVYSERNLGVVLEPVACKVTVANMPHKVGTGNRIVKVLS